MREYVDPEQLQTREAQQRKQAKAVTSTGTRKPRMLAVNIPPAPSPPKTGGYTAVSTKSIVRQT
jgi:uncharacterized membrane protein